MTSPVRAPRPTPRGLLAAPPPRPRPQLRVVRDPAPRSRAGLVVAFAIVVVFGALVAAAMAHSFLVSGQAHLDQVNEQVRSEQELLQREQLRLADAQSPGRITREALKLGMVPATENNWVSPGNGSGAVVTTTDPSTTSATTSASNELASSDTGATTHP